MAINESWLYLLDLIILFAMKHKTFFIVGLGGLLLMAIFSTSQVTMKQLIVTPQEELVNRLPDDSSRKWAFYIIEKNKETKKDLNELELKIRGIEPPK